MTQDAASTTEFIQDMIRRGALFVANHSGGKDSQAMLVKLRRLVPADQLLVIHAHLPEVEWEGSEEHIRTTSGDLPLIVCQAPKTLLEMVERRGMFPSPQQRQCTSDLKRGPIEREVRRYLKANPQFDGLVVNCMGLRAQESPNRAKATVLKYSKRNSKAGREWWDWLPIHDMTAEDVFATIRQAGEEPHWVYAAGMTRKSCCFCIMASQADLNTAAKLKPCLFRRYVELERTTGQTMFMPTKGEKRGLEEVAGITVEEAFERAA